MKLGEIILDVAFGLIVGLITIIMIEALEPSIPTYMIIQAGFMCALGSASIMFCRGILVNILQGMVDEYESNKEDDDEE